MSLTRGTREAVERCLHCPKMCRFSCPVAEQSARESLAAGSKMSLVALTVPDAPRPSSLPGPLEGLVRRARQFVQAAPERTLDADTAETFWGCTGCLRCRTWCEHENDVPSALNEGRAVAFRSGLAPAAAQQVAETMQRVGHLGGELLPERLEAIAEELPTKPGSTSVLFAGCEAPLHSPDSIRATVRAARKLGAPLGVAREPACCGRPLYEAGDREGFRRHVASAWSKLGEREVVTPSAACARALSEWAREVGVEPRGPVLHTTTYLARRLGPHVQGEPLDWSVSYHDPCHLVRGLGESEAPRRLLSAALAGSYVEPQSTGLEADCCGGSGLVARTYPQEAKAMAMARADELRSTGCTKVATACPACRSSLEQAGLEVWDVAELVDAWLGDETERS